MTIRAWVALIGLGFGMASSLARAEGPPLERIKVDPATRGFVAEPSGRPFRVWGFNYDRDASGRLLEDYWLAEWAKVETDFAGMKRLGANVVRIHLQLGRFLPEPDRIDPRQIDQLGRLLDLAERTGLYLDLTGLGCYHKADVPPWYDALSEADRWRAQAKFLDGDRGSRRAEPGRLLLRPHE